MRLKSSSPDPSAARPVILGAGLTGMAISRALSSAGIVHFLVGEPPTETPRLGESLNAEGSLEIARQFPDLARYFFPKQRQALFFGDHALGFDFVQYAAAPVYHRLIGDPAAVRLLHVDRLGLDRALFESVVADEHCLHLDGRATALDYDPVADRINAVRLAGGRRLASTYVFDATNQLRFVARKLGVGCRQLGGAQRVVFAHYRPSGKGTADQSEPWQRTTALLRLEARAGAADGLAWRIPLGDYVSVGVSVDPAKTRANPALLLDWVDKAYAGRGVGARVTFARRGAPVDLRYTHYLHERCYGRNWLLAGPSACHVWFPLAGAVASGLVAARLAPDILRSPRELSLVYQRYIDRVADSHAGLDWLTGDDPRRVTAEDLRRRAGAMAAGNAARLAGYLDLGDAPAELAGAGALTRLSAGDRRLAGSWRVDSAPPGAQATRLFAPVQMNDPWLGDRTSVPVLRRPAALRGPAAILGLVETFSGRRKVEDSVRSVAGDVEVRIDRFSLRGAAQWNAWVSSLLACRRVAKLELVPGALRGADNRWVLDAQWQGEVAGRPAVSPPFAMRFTLAKSRVAAVETQRADHAFVTGDAVLPPVAFAAMLGRFTASMTGADATRQDATM